MNFWTALVIIVAIAGFAVSRRGRQVADGGTGRESTARLEREVAELKQRIAVLERIATEDRHGRAIAEEIEQLRKR